MSAPTPFSVFVRQVSVSRADRPVLVDVDLTLTERSRAALVGPNGVGKSTLLAVIAGRLRPERGTVTAAPPTATIGLLAQELDHRQAPTVRHLLAAEAGVVEAQRALDAATEALARGTAGADAAYDRALDRFLRLGAADFDARLEAVADDLGLARTVLDRDPTVLSGGEAERVGLAAVLLSRFDLTLLDEPTNSLDLAGLDRLERWVADHDRGLMVVSHDRAFLERTAESVVEIDGHHHTVSVYQGGWTSFLTERARARAEAEQRYAEYVTERDRLAARGQQQREWADRGVMRARRFPADGDKFRRNWQLAQTERLAAKSKATLRAMERLEEVERPWQPWELRFAIDRAPRSGTVVVALDRAVLRRGDFVIGPIDEEIRWQDRVALAGPNGSGKSTVLAAILGRLAPVSGRVALGSGVVVGELGQSRDGLGGAPSVAQAVQDATGLAVDQTRSLLAKFGLDAEAVSRPVGSLSPGERTRVQLALFQAKGVNLLVLDEPTNHLDLPAIEQLESALARYDGTLLLVSHDRRLLANVELTRTIDVSTWVDRRGEAADG